MPLGDELNKKAQDMGKTPDELEKSKGGGGPVPRGEFRVRIDDAEITDNQQTGSRSLALVLEVRAPSHSGAIVRDWQCYHCPNGNFDDEEARQEFEEDAVATIRDLADFADCDGAFPDHPADLEGAECLIRTFLEEDEYEGKEMLQTRVGDYMADDREPAGADDQQPDVWHKHEGDGDAGSGGPTESFDSDEIPF